MDPMEEIKRTFFLECDELLEALHEGLAELEAEPVDDETINTIFRAVHSIKGGAASFGLNDLVRFAHTFETALDETRSGRLEATPDVLRIFLHAADILSDLVTAARDDGDVPSERLETVLAELKSHAGALQVEEAAPVEFAPLALDFDLDDDDGLAAFGADSAVRWRIVFRPHAELYERGNEPALILRELGELGEMEVLCDLDSLPPLDELDPHGAYIGWTITITTTADEEALREPFEFVDGDCTLEIVAEEVPETDGDLSALEVLPELEPEMALPGEPEGVPEPVSDAPAPESAVARNPARASGSGGTVRVDLDRVDRLINLVSELVINQAVLSQSVLESNLDNSSPIAAGLDEFKNLTREVQESVLAIRAQPVKALFQRMSRIVREAGEATGKDARLVTVGEMTEVDKTVVDRLADPLTHMIRNAVDHGLETPEKRRAAGKPAQGVIRLLAEHRSGRVLIEVADDGAGLNRERVQQIAVDKGLIPAEAVLSNSEIDNLLFLPGFSTSATVSDLSGRGVGMDVVKRSITALGGRIAITSEPGRGTSFSISLPLTLAILDGMIVTVAEETLVVPLAGIIEMIRTDSGRIHALGEGGLVVRVRESFLPVIDVGHQLGFRARVNGFANRVMLLVKTDEGEQRALLVDTIQDQRQVVIKGLDESYGQVPGIAAATILGNGRVALILDPDAIVSQATQGRLGADPSLSLAG